MPLPVRITRIVEDVGLDAGRNVVPQIRVEFMAGDHGPFVERFTKADFNADAVRRKLEEFAANLERLAR